MVGLLDRNDDGCAGGRDVWAVSNERAQLLEPCAVFHDYEMPGLDVAGARGQVTRLHDAPEHVIWNWLVLVFTDRENGADGLKDRVAHFLILLRSAV